MSPPKPPRRPHVAGYRPEALAAERDRRARVREEWLNRLPHPDVPQLVEEAGDRPDRWPPTPTRPPGAWRETIFTREVLLDRLATFAASRGPDFSMHEFLRWARMSERPYYVRLGSWTAARVAVGLPKSPRPRDRRLRTLHKLLRTLHLNGGRRLTAAALGKAAGISAPTIWAHGGVDQLLYLYRLWVDPATQRTGPDPVGGRRKRRRRREAKGTR